MGLYNVLDPEDGGKELRYFIYNELTPPFQPKKKGWRSL